MSVNYRYFCLALLMGAVIRLVGLDYQSLWMDELYSVTLANSKNLNMLYGWLIKDVHPPLYSLFLHFWIKIFGESVVSVRLPSAIAGILSIYFMHKYANKFFSEEVSVMAAVMISFSYFGIYYSQETRPYSILLLLSISSTFYWLLLLLDKNPRRIDHVKYSVLAILASYIHYFGLLLVMVQIGSWFLYNLFTKKNIKHPAIVSFIIVFAYTPWLATMISTFLTFGSGHFWISFPENLPLFFRRYLGLLFRPLNYSLILLVLVPLFVCFKGHLLNTIKFMKKHFKLQSHVFLLTAIITSVVVMSFIISIHSPVLTTRNLLIIAPFIYLFLAIWVRLSSIDKNHVVGYVFLSCLFCLFTFLPTYYNTPQKEQWREAVFYVIDTKSEKAAVVTSPIPSQPFPTPSMPELFNYYFRYFEYDKIEAAGNLNGVLVTDFDNFKVELDKSDITDLYIIEAHWLVTEESLIESYRNISEEFNEISLRGAKVYHFSF